MLPLCYQWGVFNFLVALFYMIDQHVLVVRFYGFFFCVCPSDRLTDGRWRGGLKASGSILFEGFCEAEERPSGGLN